MAFENKKPRQKTDRRSFNDDRDSLAPIRKRTAIDPNIIIDENDVEFLKRYVTEYGKIIPARISGVTAIQQRRIKAGIRRARNMGLMA